MRRRQHSLTGHDILVTDSLPVSTAIIAIVLNLQELAVVCAERTMAEFSTLTAQALTQALTLFA